MASHREAVLRILWRSPRMHGDKSPLEARAALLERPDRELLDRVSIGDHGQLHARRSAGRRHARIRASSCMNSRSAKVGPIGRRASVAAGAVGSTGRSGRQVATIGGDPKAELGFA